MATTNNCFTIIGMKLIGTKNPFKQCKHALELKMDFKASYTAKISSHCLLV